MEITRNRKRRESRHTVAFALMATVMLVFATHAPCWAASTPQPGPRAFQLSPRAFQLGGWGSLDALRFNPFAPWASLRADDSQDGDSSREAVVSAPKATTSKTRPKAAATKVSYEPSKVILIPAPKLSSTQKVLFHIGRPCIRTPYKPLPPSP